MTLDNPNTRRGTICPLCGCSKKHGLVACWPCYRNFGLKYGNPAAEKTIARFECRAAQPYRQPMPAFGRVILS